MVRPQTASGRTTVKPCIFVASDDSTEPRQSAVPGLGNFQIFLGSPKDDFIRKQFKEHNTLIARGGMGSFGPSMGCECLMSFWEVGYKLL